MSLIIINSMNPNLSHIQDYKEKSSKLQAVYHNFKVSMDSIYSQSFNETFSISNAESRSSVDSVEVQKVVAKNKEITEIVTSRLTAFLFMSKKIYGENGFIPIQEFENIKKSLSETLSICRENEDKESEIFVKGVLDQIMNLQKELNALSLKLQETQVEIKYTETEETELKEHMNAMETNISRFVLESQDSKSIKCQCEVF
jgi:hypothetical protein